MLKWITTRRAEMDKKHWKKRKKKKKVLAWKKNDDFSL